MRVHNPVDSAPQFLEVGEREFPSSREIANPGKPEGFTGDVFEYFGPFLLGGVYAPGNRTRSLYFMFSRKP